MFFAKLHYLLSTCSAQHRMDEAPDKTIYYRGYVQCGILLFIIFKADIQLNLHDFFKTLDYS